MPTQDLEFCRIFFHSSPSKLAKEPKCQIITKKKLPSTLKCLYGVQFNFSSLDQRHQMLCINYTQFPSSSPSPSLFLVLHLNNTAPFC